jgi:hypothetical protein
MRFRARTAKCCGCCFFVFFNSSLRSKLSTIFSNGLLLCGCGGIAVMAVVEDFSDFAQCFIKSNSRFAGR